MIQPDQCLINLRTSLLASSFSSYKAKRFPAHVNKRMNHRSPEKMCFAGQRLQSHTQQEMRTIQARRLAIRATTANGRGGWRSGESFRLPLGTVSPSSRACLHATPRTPFACLDFGASPLGRLRAFRSAARRAEGSGAQREELLVTETGNGFLR